jgi:hypothetical protein
MARPQRAEFDKKKVVAENRRARFDYAIEEKFEAGIALTGTEVKSLRSGEGTIAESYAEVKDDEAWLINSNVPEFSHGNRFNHEPKRPRKLLLKRRELEKLHGAVARSSRPHRTRRKPTIVRSASACSRLPICCTLSSPNTAASSPPFCRACAYKSAAEKT